MSNSAVPRENEADYREGVPKWVWLVIAALACIEPLTHVWIAHFPPAGTVPTGMHVGDSGHHLICMRMFETGFHSPFAKDAPPYGTHHFGFFAPPLFLLYGVLGLIRRALGVDAFLFLGLANGVGGALYLASAYAFLRAVVPRHANRAFLLFALGGGLGGVLFVVTGALGLHAAPAFEEYFRRYAHYGLIEGPHLSPVLLTPRLYYTLPMALALGGLTAFVRVGRWPTLRAARECGRRRSRRQPKAQGGGKQSPGFWDATDSAPEGRQQPMRTRHLVVAGALLFCATFINVRVGPVAWVIAALHLACRTDRPGGERLRLGVGLAAPVALGAALASAMIGLSPAYSANLIATVKMSMWLSPFVSATVFYFLVVPCEVGRGLRVLPPWLRVAAWAAVGYLAAFAVLYLGYQAYYGNVWRCLDVTVAIRMSDWALLGAPMGALWAMRRRAPRDEASEANGTAWVVLWLLFFLALALSAFGQGWFMRLNPQRLMIWLGLPICILGAQGLARIEGQRRKLGRALTAIIVGCGVCSIAVASLFFQGPLGREPGKGPFAYLHYEVMTRADAHILDRLEEGRVLTPPWSPISFGEIVALRPGLSVVGGPGAMNISAERFGPLQAQVEQFFNVDGSDEARRDLVREWGVDYVYCPDTCPVDEALLDKLRSTEWLHVVAEQDKAVLFKVGGPIQSL